MFGKIVQGKIRPFRRRSVRPQPLERQSGQPRDAERTTEGSKPHGRKPLEADLKQSDLRDATLCDTCFCRSNLTACDFSGARFGATDIAQAILSGAVFSTLSALDLDFQSAQTMSDCAFIQPDGPPCPSAPRRL
ncbi:MAG: pentapeptide repeat-containing protein [Alphaproteobacteria bacterium]|nr:pentapeptide repeat-containing protein [Alphaproteobacteria bacterium]